MEQRRYARIAVNLNVALIDDRTMPRGCRVRDVSQGGMLLQFEPVTSGEPYEPGQAVKVRASVKDGEQRRVLLLPATIRRVEDKAVGVEFLKPEAELMQLLEPYQLDKELPAQAATVATESDQAAAGGGVHAFATTRPRHRHTAPHGGARLAERIAAAREAIASSGHLDNSTVRPSEAPPVRGTDRRMLHVGLASLAVAVAIVIFDLAASSSTRERLAALETAAHHQAEALADVQIRLTADRAPDRLASLDNRVHQLSVTVAALETGQFAPAESNPAPGASSGNDQPDVATAARTTESRTESAPPPLSAPASTPGGPWVINLVSLYDQAAADRFSRQARDKGISVAQNQAEVQGRQVWRLQVDGFATRDAAVAFSEANKHKLGLKKVWIFRR